jgi:hypothetical protein
MTQVVGGMTYDHVVEERHMPFGTVQQALEVVRWLDTIGVTHLGLTFRFGGMEHGAALHAMELWAREVGPTMRAMSGAPTTG